MKKLTFFIAAICTIPTAAHAENWTRMGRSSDNAMFYYDIDSIRFSGSIISIWTLIDYTPDKTRPQAYTKIFYNVNCTSQRLMPIEYIRKPIDTIEVEQTLIDPADRFSYTPQPGNVDHQVMVIACGL
ncbi:MAG TPA: surface-adhesin E family protein [Croceicoccus sp.]|nr:surface-adhesin E family protein [Croceicoccus sp.]